MIPRQMPTDDDDLIALLRQSLEAIPETVEPTADPVPASVVDGAKWIHEWLNMDAELAELTFDSNNDLELAGTRSFGSLRELTFVSGDYTVELEIQPGARSVEVSGTIEPVVAGSMQLVIGGEIFGSDIDATGSFHIENVARGTVLAFVELPGRKIRLGSFEV